MDQRIRGVIKEIQGEVIQGKSTPGNVLKHLYKPLHPYEGITVLQYPLNNEIKAIPGEIDLFTYNINPGEEGENYIQ